MNDKKEIKKTVKDIITEWLIQNGCNGLTDECGCGCHIIDLAPCGDLEINCVAAIDSVPGDQCYACDASCDDSDFCMVAKVFEEEIEK